MPYDLEASHAHATMLARTGILTNQELKDVDRGLSEIKVLWENGSFQIDRSQEDCHTAIEAYLTSKYGEV